MASYEESAELLEEFFESCVTATPLVLEFMAADIADYNGVPVGEMSQALQAYRPIASGVTPVTAEYTIGTYQRGPRSIWYIFTWPGMTVPQRETAGGIFLHHEIMSTLREDIKPM